MSGFRARGWRGVAMECGGQCAKLGTGEKEACEGIPGSGAGAAAGRGGEEDSAVVLGFRGNDGPGRMVV